MPAKNEKQKEKSTTNNPGSGTAYHNEHAGSIEGYGEIHVQDATNMKQDKQ
ncbi:hypothetical protein OEV98_15085 [Caldibacillus lycopersici]|uniref:Uncharacterized protein n=1 Tax=Perspicuibacillus lycopersici TaxID=1325689 RepID=A0AAE3IVA3_9BACI|nr:hypothetical protein [Perspicuibacillus lycopersici]MCU9614867.1 hypothetical protein [Perspicuibacillus lycopersici]